MEPAQEVQTQNKKNTNIAVYGALLVIITGLGVYLYNTKMSPQEVRVQNAPAQTSEQTPKSAEEAGSAVRSYIITARNFEFDATELKVKKGDTVKVSLYNSEGSHDFVLDEFNVRAEVLDVGESQEVEFIADKIGKFEYYCSVGSHRAMGMVGKLIVEE